MSLISTAVRLVLLFMAAQEVLASENSTNHAGCDRSWASSLGNATFKYYFQSVATDRFGDVLATGLVNVATEGNDVFVTRVSGVNGTQLWTSRFGSSEEDKGRSVVTDVNSVYAFVSGYTYGNLSAVRSGYLDCFVRKFNIETGAAEWSVQFSMGSWCEAEASVLDFSASSLFIVGLTTTPEVNSFARKTSCESGAEQWTVQFGVGSTRATCVTRDSLHIYVAGFTYGDFGSTSSGQEDCFVRKLLQSTGEEVWTVQYGTAAHDYPFGITYSSFDEALFVTGGLDSPQNEMAYVRKVSSSNGSEVWTQSFVLGNQSRGHGVAVDVTSVYVVGWFQETKSGLADVFVLKLMSSSGSIEWNKTFTNSSSNGDATSVDILDTTSIVFVENTLNSYGALIRKVPKTFECPPTSAPTPSPTDVPTEMPTSQPSPSPTSVPTSAPTVSPSVFPTTSPSLSPTASPSEAPTAGPTPQPTPDVAVQPSPTPNGTNGTVAPDVSHCGRGTYASSGRCVSCPIGRFNDQDGNLSSCYPCNQLRFTVCSSPGLESPACEGSSVWDLSQRKCTEPSEGGLSVLEIVAITIAIVGTVVGILVECKLHCCRGRCTGEKANHAGGHSSSQDNLGDPAAVEL